jgi:hypothetical protein
MRDGPRRFAAHPRSGKIDAPERKMVRGKLEGLNVARRRFYAGKR